MNLTLQRNLARKTEVEEADYQTSEESEFINQRTKNAETVSICELASRKIVIRAERVEKKTDGYTQFSKRTSKTSETETESVKYSSTGNCLSTKTGAAQRVHAKELLEKRRQEEKSDSNAIIKFPA